MSELPAPPRAPPLPSRQRVKAAAAAAGSQTSRLPALAVNGAGPPGTGPARPSPLPASAAGPGHGAAPGAVSTFASEHLKSPDDLAKIAVLRRKLEKEQTMLEAKLKSGAKEQLEATREGLIKLQGTRQDMALIREAFVQIDALSDRPSGSQPVKEHEAFKLIAEVSQVHRNFVQTSAVLDKLLALPAQVAQLQVLLAEAQEDFEHMGPAEHLIPLHYHLSKLQNFKATTLVRAEKSMHPASRARLEEVFYGLDALGKGFDMYLLALAARSLDFAREGRLAVVVKAFKVIEKEGRDDEKTAAIRLAKRAHLEGASRFDPASPLACRRIKLYRLKAFEAIEAETKKLFDELWATYGADSGDRMGLLEHMGWLFEDLEYVKTDLARLFPPDYGIFPWYVKLYHRQLGKMLDERILATEPEASALLTLYQFAKEYEQTMLRDVGAEPSWLQPSLLGGREDEMIDDYLRLIVRKIDEWTANLMHDEAGVFVSREEPPEEDSEGQYGMQGAVILFQMVNQQMDLAAESGEGSILTRAIEHACTAMTSRQTTWLRILEQEYHKQADAKQPELVVGGLVEYIIALANDQLKSAEYTEALQERMVPQVDPRFRGPIREATDNVLNGFLDVSKRCTQVLVELMFADLRPAVKELFVFPTWYTEGLMAQIVETFRDYSSDYVAHLNPNLFEVLQDDILDRFLVTYFAALYKTNKLRMPVAADAMRRDIEEVSTLFVGYGREDEMQEKLEVMHQVLGLITSSSTMAFLSYWTFAKSNGPQLAFVEHVLRARDDLEKADVTAVMDSAKRKVAAEALADVPAEGGPTPIHRAMKLAQASGGLAGLVGTGLGHAANSLFANLQVGARDIVSRVGESVGSRDPGLVPPAAASAPPARRDGRVQGQGQGQKLGITTDFARGHQRVDSGELGTPTPTEPRGWRGYFGGR